MEEIISWLSGLLLGIFRNEKMSKDILVDYFKHLKTLYTNSENLIE